MIDALLFIVLLFASAIAFAMPLLFSMLLNDILSVGKEERK